MDALAEVVRLVPADLKSSWQLCTTALRNGSNEVALREASKIVAVEPTMIGPYRVAARACARIGDYQRAAEILDHAFARFPDSATIAAERREAHDLRLGLEKMETADRGYIPQVQSNFLAPLPEVIQLPAFHREVAAALLELIVELHRNPFRAMRDQSYVEADFRDTAVHRLSARWSNTHAEPIAATGFADLVVSSDNRVESFVSEFKIWGCNDYLHATEQVVGYSGLRDPAVAIVMINPNQEDITSAYVEQLIVGHPSYIPASYRRRPLEPQSEHLTHFLSRYRDPLGRSVTVFHFVCNAVLSKQRKKKVM